MRRSGTVDDRPGGGSLRLWRAPRLRGSGGGRRSGFSFLLLARFDRRRPLLEPEAVSLADHRVAGNAAELVGDLAGGGAIVPHLLQALDALFGPRHC